MILYVYGYKLLSSQEWENLLRGIDNKFNPALSQKTDINIFADKLFKHANTILVYDFDHIVGVCAFYDNNIDAAFLTLMYIDYKYRKQGIATKLVNQMERIILEKGVRILRLEVDKANTKAIIFYNKIGFNVTEKKGSSLCMIKIY